VCFRCYKCETCNRHVLTIYETDVRLCFKVVEQQYEQFRQEMALRFEEKNSHLHHLEEENARLKLTSNKAEAAEAAAEAVAKAARSEAEAAELNERCEAGPGRYCWPRHPTHYHPMT
jgi:hypothetical protein